MGCLYVIWGSNLIALPVRITDINYGNHLGHIQLIGLMHEARLQVFHTWGLSETHCFGRALVVRELSIRYSKESFYGDSLDFDIQLGVVKKCSFSLLYMIKRGCDTIATASIELVCLDPNTRRIQSLPSQLLQSWNQKGLR